MSIRANHAHEPWQLCLPGLCPAVMCKQLFNMCVTVMCLQLCTAHHVRFSGSSLHLVATH